MLARIQALFWGLFCLLNLAGELARHGFDGNTWWVDLRAVPWWMSDPLLALGGAALLACGIRPPHSAWRRSATQLLTILLLVFALWNAVEFYRLLARGEIASSVPVPLSLVVGASLAWIVLWLRLGCHAITRLRGRECPSQLPTCPSPRTGKGMAPSTAPGWFWLWAGPALAACMIAFALLQIALFGNTDYRRPADAIVVFGAGLTPDGQCSQALYDRVRTACLLHQQGYSRRSIMSGGPSASGVHETEAMRDLATNLGVPDADIVLDPQGVSTKATVENTCRLFEQLGAKRVLAVSQGFHLPRIKMAYQRKGLEVYTVPAETTRPLEGLPYYVAREVLALWYYYFRPMA